MRSRSLPFSRLVLAALLAAGMLLPAMAGTKVRIATSVGNIDLELYDQDRPITVQNFLNYVRSGRYANTFIHRLVPGAVVQGGAFLVDASSSLASVQTDAAIQNEFNGDPKFSNVKGTITMAKIPPTDSEGTAIDGGGPNTATSSWFINLADNNTGDETNNFDLQNGGFTVFGRVIAGFNVLEMFNSGFPYHPTSSTGPGVYNKSFSLGLDELPLLADSLNLNNFIYTDVFVLPPLQATLAGKRKFRVHGSKTQIFGSGSRGMDSIEWQVGAKGLLHSQAVSNSWAIKITGLKKGTTKVYFRAATASGERSAFQVVQIVRK